MVNQSTQLFFELNMCNAHIRFSQALYIVASELKIFPVDFSFLLYAPFVKQQIFLHVLSCTVFLLVLLLYTTAHMYVIYDL